jgi:hypothetical protein
LIHEWQHDRGVIAFDEERLANVRRSAKRSSAAPAASIR